jgi:hypothetical protein
VNHLDANMNLLITCIVFKYNPKTHEDYFTKSPRFRNSDCHLGLEIMVVSKQNKCPHKIEIVTSMIGPKLEMLTMS